MTDPSKKSALSQGITIQQHVDSQTDQPDKSDGLPKHFNNMMRSFLSVFKKLYRDQPSLVTIFIAIVLLCSYFLFKAINNNYVYSAVVTFLFIFLSICLYIKEKNSLNSIFSFSLGIFTAFTVSWNSPTFSIFFLSFIVLLTGIFFVSSIRAAANVEEKLTTAAISYIGDFETNKKDLQEVKASVTKQEGLLPIDTVWEAILFFAYQKVPKNQMITLISAVNYVYTVTKVDSELLLVLLSNIYYLAQNENELEVNAAILKLYILKGKSTPGNLVKILNDTLHIAIENNINFAIFTETILTYLSSGYARERIVEKLSAKFTGSAK